MLGSTAGAEQLTQRCVRLVLLLSAAITHTRSLSSVGSSIILSRFDDDVGEAALKLAGRGPITRQRPLVQAYQHFLWTTPRPLRILPQRPRQLPR